MPTLPKFSQLPLAGQTGERHAWGVFGKDDQLGTVSARPRSYVRAK